MILLQGRAGESLVLLKDGNNPVTGLTYTNVTVKFRVPNSTSYAIKTLNALNFIEFADGYYAIKWTALELTNLGSLLVKIESVSGDPFDTNISNLNIIPNSVLSLVSPSLCIISGNIRDISGNPAIGDVISFNAVTGPISAGDSFLKSTILTTSPDAFGNFSVALTRGVKVKVTLKTVGVQYVFTVPNQETANLIDLLPLPT